MAVGNVGSSGTDRVEAAKSNQQAQEARADNEKRQTRTADEAQETRGAAEPGRGENVNLQA